MVMLSMQNPAFAHARARRHLHEFKNRFTSREEFVNNCKRGQGLGRYFQHIRSTFPLIMIRLGFRGLLKTAFQANIQVSILALSTELARQEGNGDPRLRPFALMSIGVCFASGGIALFQAGDLVLRTLHAFKEIRALEDVGIIKLDEGKIGQEFMSPAAWIKKLQRWVYITCFFMMLVGGTLGYAAMKLAMLYVCSHYLWNMPLDFDPRAGCVTALP